MKIIKLPSLEVATANLTEEDIKDLIVKFLKKNDCLVSFDGNKENCQTKKKMPRWGHGETQILIQYYKSGYTYEEMAKILNRTPIGIMGKLARLKKENEI